jgi:hypothetical protein
MPTESELRQQFHGDEPGGSIDRGSIDVDAVLRRSRARRRPRVAAAAVVSSLAVIGIVVPVSISIAGTHVTTAALDAGSAASAPAGPAAGEAIGGSDASGSLSGGSSKRAPADKINLCTGPLATPAPAEDGLVLTVAPVEAAASARDIPVTVTLTNTGAQRVTGSVSPFPAVTLSRNGIVLWHSNGAVPSLAQEVDLAPGASTSFSTTFQPVVCGVRDDEQESFRDDLPAAGPGSYQLSAALDLTPATADASGQIAAVLVSGPTSLVTLH